MIATYIPYVMAVCFLPNGTVNTNLVPCDPGSEVSTCCSTVDFCLSNGLCMDAGGNNGLTIQGCTAQNWGSPCNLHCPVSGACMYLRFQAGWCNITRNSILTLSST